MAIGKLSGSCAALRHFRGTTLNHPGRSTAALLVALIALASVSAGWFKIHPTHRQAASLHAAPLAHPVRLAVALQRIVLVLRDAVQAGIKEQPASYQDVIEGLEATQDATGKHGDREPRT